MCNVSLGDLICWFLSIFPWMPQHQLLILNQYFHELGASSQRNNVGGSFRPFLCFLWKGSNPSELTLSRCTSWHCRPNSTPLSVSSWHSDVPTHATLMQKKHFAACEWAEQQEQLYLCRPQPDPLVTGHMGVPRNQVGISKRINEIF